MLNVEVFDDRFFQIVDMASDLQLMSDQFLFTEGPIWDAVDRSLTFSDIADSKMWRWTEQRGFFVLREHTNKANGNTYDHTGHIITCEHATSRLIRTWADGTGYEVLASHYLGKELNAPNDVVVRSDGIIYFSDPYFGRKPTWIGVGRPLQLDFQGVFFLNPNTGELHVASKEFASPNGLCFSSDEKAMYVADTPMHKIYSFDVDACGYLVNKRLFADTAYQGEGGPDGLKLGPNGTVFCAAQGGLHVYADNGTRLGIVKTPKTVANFCFGGPDGKSVFLTAQSSVYHMRLC